MDRKQGAIAMLLLAGLILAVSLPGAFATSQIDKIDTTAVTTNQDLLNLTDSTVNVTIHSYTNVAGANTTYWRNATDGRMVEFCANTTLGGSASGRFNTTCPISGFPNGDVAIKMVVNYTSAAGAENSSHVAVNYDSTVPTVTVNESISSLARKTDTITLSVACLDTNFTVKNATIKIEQEPAYNDREGYWMTRLGSSDTFTLDLKPTNRLPHVWQALCWDYHGKNTGWTNKRTITFRSGATLDEESISVEEQPGTSTGGQALAGSNKQIWVIGGAFVVVVVLLALAVVAITESGGGKKGKR